MGHHDEVGQVEEHPHHQAGEAVLREQDETEHIKFSVLPPVLWIRIIGFNADPDPAFLVNADPDAGPYPGF